jgi:hypothetical protein
MSHLVNLKSGLLFLWALAVIAAFSALTVYSNTAGARGEIVSEWPKASALVRDTEKPTLLVFVHPQCSCSAATIGELDRLMTDIAGKANVHVVFFKPKNKDNEWVESSTWQSVQSIPTVKSEIDIDGVEARKFGVETSGNVLLYDEHGKLKFRGGITPSRAHMGDNLGRDFLLSYFANPSLATQLSQASIFGCSIRKIASSFSN